MTQRILSAHAMRTLMIMLIAAFAVTSMVRAAEPASEDPATLAATYAEQAAELRKSAEKHATMARMHRGGAGSSKTAHASVVRHCERIAENLRAAADESEALAATYRTLAENK